MKINLLKTGLLILAIFAFLTAAAGRRNGVLRSNVKVGSGGPSISYSTTQTYTVGTAISPLAPTASGVYAASYNSTPYGYSGAAYSVSIALAPNGDIYTMDQNNNTVSKLPADGGPAVLVASGFTNIESIAVDGAGNLYVSDASTSITEIVASSGNSIKIGSGFSNPDGIAVDASGNVYVADFGNHAVKEISAGIGSTITLSSQVPQPYGVSVDRTGNVYVSDFSTGDIIKLSPGGTKQTVIGSGFSLPANVVLDNTGNVYVSDEGHNVIVEIPADGGSQVTLNQSFFDVSGLAIDGYGNLYETHGADNNGNSLTRITPTGGYFITPALPPGLNFDSNTGIISGTPVSASPTTVYTVSAYNPLGGASFALSIKVNPPPPPTVSYTSSVSYTVGTTITPLSPLASGVASPAYATSAVFAQGSVYMNQLSVDGGGDVLAADDNGYIEKISPGSSRSDTIQSGFSEPYAVVSDASGNMYVADRGAGKVYKIPVGTTTHVAIGSGFTSPECVTIDRAGNVYVADYASTSVKEILASTGATITVATGFTHPSVVGVDGAGNIYVIDSYYETLSKVSPGSTTPVVIANGNFNAMAIDNAGNIYLSPSNAGIIEIQAGSTTQAQIAPATLQVFGLGIDQAGLLYAADIRGLVSKIAPAGGYYISPALPAGLSFNSNIGVISGTPDAVSPASSYQITAYNSGGPTSITITIAVRTAPAATLTYASPKTYIIGNTIAALTPASSGVAAQAYSTLAALTATGFNGPTNVAVDAAGNVFVADRLSNTVQEIPAGTNTPFVIAGGFNHPYGVAVDAAGYVYVADLSNNAVKKIAPGGSPVTTIGSGFSSPSGVAVDQKGNVFVADWGNGAIKKIPAGNGTPVTIASGFDEPLDVAVDSTGNLYVASFVDQEVYKIPAGGNTPVVIGSGYSSPSGVAVDALGNVFISDAPYKAIEEIPANGGALIRLMTSTDQLSGVAVSPSGVVYFADQTNNQISQVNPVGGYYLSNPLPPGLSFNGSTGVISGKPLSLSPPTNYTVTAYNAGGPTAATVNISVTATINATLSGLTISNGTLSPAFASTTTTYSAGVGYGLTTMTVTPTAADPAATIKVQGKAVASGTASQHLTLAVGANAIPIVVTGSDGITTKTYTLNVNEAHSSNNNLSHLTISGGTLSPAFTSATTSYTSAVPYATVSTTITPTFADPNATAKVNGTPVTSGSASPAIALAVGTNTVTIVVTAQNSTTKTYTITITRSAPSTNSDLAELAVSKGTLSPTFATATLSYTDNNVTNGTTSVTLTPTLADPTATVTVNGTAVASGKASGPISLTVGSNNVSVVVTAQDGVTKQTYTVNVIRPSTNAKLSAFTISSGTLTPAFNGNTTSYTAPVTNATSSITVTPTVAVTGATVTVNGAAVISGSPSGAIALSVGANTITTVVTAQDGVTKNNYTLTVTRAMAGANDVYEPASVGVQNVELLLADDGINVHQGVSPNGDGINDFLQIDNITNYPDNNLKIMNRNGQLVYEAKGYDNATRVFDGHSNKTGQMQLPGTYFYELDYVVKGITKQKTGFLVLKY